MDQNELLLRFVYLPLAAVTGATSGVGPIVSAIMPAAID